MKSAAPTPYDARETLGLLWRNLAGPSRDNPAGIGFLPATHTLADIEPALTLGFTGDAMMMFGYPLQVAPAVQAFFAPCDHVVVNLEGVITDQPKRGPDQKHAPAIVDQLAQLAAPGAIALSVANNHAADFGAAACRASMELFARRGMRLFGLRDCPALNLAPRLRLVAGTQWSNRPGEFLARLDDPARHCRDGALNILCAHWGHEMECYPRTPHVAQARQWLDHFDAIVGHHSHVPQPVSVLDTPGGPRLVAWSLGDLCFGLGFKRWPALRHYPYGILLRMTVGPRRGDPAGRWALGTVEWCFSDCAWQARERRFLLQRVDRIPYFAGTG